MPSVSSKVRQIKLPEGSENKDIVAGYHLPIEVGIYG